MKRLLAALTALVALSAACLPAASFAAPAVDPAKRVVIVLAPYLTWSDLDPGSTPRIWELAQDAAIGDINARSRTREPGERPSPLEGALTISAGAWAVPVFDAPAAYNIGDRYEVGNAAEAFERMTGQPVGDDRIVFLGEPMTDRLNAERAPDVVIGTLGEAVKDAGGITAAIGNSDVGYVTGEQRFVRPAALAAMDAVGRVALGDISTALIAEDPEAPFGVRTDLDVFDKAMAQVAETTARHAGPALVVLDAGDSYRAIKFETQVTPEVAEKQRLQALKTLDIVVGKARERFPDAVVMVVSQATGDPKSGRPEGLGPVIVSGDGWDGLLLSDSTQREGLVNNLDVPATAMAILGIERPVQVLGNQMRATPDAGDLQARVDRLRRMDATAVAIDGAKPGVVNTFVALTVAVLVIAALVLVRARMWLPSSVVLATRLLRGALLLLMCVVPASWLMFVWMPWPATALQATGALVATALAIWVLALLLAAKSPTRVPIAVLALLTTVVLLVDQWLGAPASFTNFFGYSPLLAARFYGMGNEAAAILFGASVVGLALLFDEWPEAKWTRIAKRYVLPLVGLAVMFTAAAPFLGANVGVAIWGTVGFGLAWFLMNGHHVSWKTLLWLFVASAVIIIGFAAIDLVGGRAQTHLGRAIGSAEQGGLIELWNIVARKAATNARVLTRTNWAYILVAVLAFLGFMRWRPQGDFADMLTRNPDFADAITVSLAAGVVAYFTEDSGIVIPALEFFFMGIALVWLMLGRERDASLAKLASGEMATDGDAA